MVDKLHQRPGHRETSKFVPARTSVPAPALKSREAANPGTVPRDNEMRDGDRQDDRIEARVSLGEYSVETPSQVLFGLSSQVFGDEGVRRVFVERGLGWDALPTCS